MSQLRVPDQIRQLALSRKGDVLRKEYLIAQAEMRKLDISTESEIFAFFSEFKASALYSTSSYEELMDVSEPTPQIALGTSFVRDVWKLPAEYICLTSAEGEGCYLYSTQTDAVYDFALAEHESFLWNPMPRWESFFQFIEWYLSPAAQKS